MTKIVFLFLQKSDDLWVQVLQSKYFREVDGNLRPRKSKSQSALWRGVLRAWGFVLDGARAGIGNGEETLFWTGKWLNSGNKLIDLVSNVNEPIDLEAPVINFIDADGEWDIPRLRRHLDEDAIQEIVGMPRDCDFAGRVWDLLEFQQSDALRTCGRVDQWLRLLVQHKRSTEAGIMCWQLLSWSRVKGNLGINVRAKLWQFASVSNVTGKSLFHISIEWGIMWQTTWLTSGMAFLRVPT
ncbi:hypothetical protein LINPERHAP1_LOCUS25137 [Linum perenne]